MFYRNNRGCGCAPAPVACPPYVTFAPVATTYAGYQHTPFEVTVRNCGCGEAALNGGYQFNGYGYRDGFYR
ncbi:MAG: hypothetical protein FWG40_04460 [Peptococcaceae bacterium]|nr:hypothetical protein [Peptococcaceae bacterium]